MHLVGPSYIWMSVSWWVLCAVQAEASATSRSLVQGSTTECMCVNNSLHLQWTGRTGMNKKKKENWKVILICHQMSWRDTPGNAVPSCSRSSVLLLWRTKLVKWAVSGVTVWDKLTHSNKLTQAGQPLMTVKLLKPTGHFTYRHV